MSRGPMRSVCTVLPKPWRARRSNRVELVEITAPGMWYTSLLCWYTPPLSHRLEFNMREDKPAKGLHCPRCGDQLELDDEYSDWDIIIATGISCKRCGANIIIERNIPRLDP